MTRASQSIVDNIVEGCGAASRPEFARYLDISIKSTSEVDYQLEFARDLGVIPHDVWKPLATEVIEIRKMLSALRRSVVAAALRDKQSRVGGIAPSKANRQTRIKRSVEARSEDPGAGEMTSEDPAGEMTSEDPGTDD